MSFVMIGGISIIAVFIWFIFQKKPLTLADKALLVLNLFLAAFLGTNIWVENGLNSYNFILQNFLPLALFPTFLFYVLLHIQLRLSKYWNLLILAPTLFLLYALTDHFLLNNYSQSELNELFNEPPLSYQVFYKSSQVLFISICIWLLSRFKKYHEEIKENFSNIEVIDLYWLKRMTWIYLIITLITFLGFLSVNLGLLPSSITQVYAGLNGILVLGIFYMNSQGIKHYTLANYSQKQHTTQNDLILDPTLENTVDEKPKIQDQRKLEIAKGIEQLFEKEKVYLEPQLKLTDLAQQLNDTTHNVSEVLNNHFEKSFYDFVNGYRVAHFKSLLTDTSKNKEYTILALGLESGFNSKASMNRIFKNHTGQTPLEYQKKESLNLS